MLHLRTPRVLNSLKTILKITPFYYFYNKFSGKEKSTDTTNTIIYVHIGKCGGESLWKAIQQSERIQKRFSNIRRIHVAKPPILKNANYLIVVRNPIARALSAFNWRYKLVVSDEVQKTRFKGEHQILIKYGTLNSLAERLYTDGITNEEVARDFRSIHHLKEDIGFYLTELLKRISSEQIYAVMATEALDQDIKATLGITNVGRIHQNSSSNNDVEEQLSKIAQANLRNFLVADYRAIEKLMKLTTSHAAAAMLLWNP